MSVRALNTQRERERETDRQTGRQTETHTQARADAQRDAHIHIDTSKVEQERRAHLNFLLTGAAKETTGRSVRMTVPALMGSVATNPLRLPSTVCTLTCRRSSVAKLKSTSSISTTQHSTTQTQHSWERRPKKESVQKRAMVKGAKEEDAVFGFAPKHQWSTQNNILSGILLGAWCKVVWKYRGVIEWRTYWFRVLFLTLMACLNSVLAFLERLFFSSTIKNAVVNKRPVFIIGQWSLAGSVCVRALCLYVCACVCSYIVWCVCACVCVCVCVCLSRSLSLSLSCPYLSRHLSPSLPVSPHLLPSLSLPR